MGDSRRFNVFANFIKENFPKCNKIADIAGDKGYLQTALRNQPMVVTNIQLKPIILLMINLRKRIM